jgi:hypothetical protein
MAIMDRNSNRMLGLALATVFVAAAGCTMKDTPAPGLTGPSALGRSVTVTASPDLLVMDGVSRSQIGVEVKTFSGAAVSGFALHLKLVDDYGRLAVTQAVTGGDGRASVTYTAPKAVIGAAARTETVEMTPIGTDHAVSIVGRRDVVIHLLPPPLF